MHKFPLCGEMAPEDERDLIEAVVTCEGNLHDPDFSDRFQSIVNNLKSILYTTNNKPLKVRKVEPWNSVRVTISIPKEAAQRLRLLAQQGSNVLRQLGILSVQVEGDQVISLTLAGRFNEPQEVILRQSNESTNSGASPSAASTSSLCSSSSTASSTSSSVPPPIVPTAGPCGVMVSLDVLSSSSSSAFRSPNVVAPSGESIPFPPKNVPVGPRPPLGGPFPFASMTHAAHTMQRSETTSSNNSTQISPSVTNSTNSNNTTNPSSNNANINATTPSLPTTVATIVTTHVPSPTPTPSPTPAVIPASVTSGPHVRNSISSTSKVNVTVSPSATPPPLPLPVPTATTILTTPATTLSAPVRKNSNNNNNLNSPNVNVVSKPQPVLVTAVVNAKNNNNNNSSNSNSSGSSSQSNNGNNNVSNTSFIPPSTPPNVVVVVNNTNFSKPAQVQGDAKLNPSQHVQHLQHSHHHSKLQTVLKASAGVTTVLSSSLSLKDKASESTPPPPPPPPVTVAAPTTVMAIAGGNPQLTSTGKPRQFLINPLTGHLEPMPSESSSDSEGDDEEHHKRGGMTNKPNKVPHSHLVKSVTKGKDNPTVNAAGWDKLSLPPPKPVKITLDSLKFNRFIQATPPPGSACPTVLVSRKSREDSGSASVSGLDTLTHPPLAKENHSVAHHLNNATTPSANSPVDKIKKLRLKLEKGESLSPASYKMDVTYVKKSEKSSLSTGTSSSSSGASSATMVGQFSTGNPSSTGSGSGGYHHHSSSSQSPPVSSQSDVPRVPPLHISLRGKNAAVVVSPRRDDSLKDLPSGVMSSSSLPSVLTSNSILNEKLIVSVNPSKTSSSSTSMAIKRTKIRLKSSDGSGSHGESRSGSGESKKAGKNFQSRPNIPTQLQSSVLTGMATSMPMAVGHGSVEEREDPLKARLKSEDKLNSASSTLSEFGKGKSASVSDLISGNPGAISSVNAMSAAAVSSSSPSSATLLPVKVKKHRRKSESVPSSRQVFIPSQSHDREVIRSPNSVAEASQLMKLLSQQVAKEEVSALNLSLTHPVTTAATPHFTSPISSITSTSMSTLTSLSMLAAKSTAPVAAAATDAVVVNAVVESSPISCDTDKDRDRSTSTVGVPVPSLAPTKVVVATEMPATSRLVLPPVAILPATPSLFTLDNKDNDNHPPKEPTEQNPVEKKPLLPLVLVKASDIPKHEQDSQAQTNELEIATSTAIPDSKLSKSPYSNKPLPDLLALPLPAVVPGVSDVCKSEVTASSQSLIFSLSSQLPQQPQLKHHHITPPSLMSSLVSKDSSSFSSFSTVPTLPVVTVSVSVSTPVPVQGDSGVVTTASYPTLTMTTQSAIVVSSSVSELVMPKNSKTSSASNSSNCGSLHKPQQQLHTHSQLITPISSTTTSCSTANTNATAATTAIALASSSLLESSSVQSVGSSILNQMLTGKDSLQMHSQSSIYGTGSLNSNMNPNPKTTSCSLPDFPSNLTAVNVAPITSNSTAPSVLIARVQNLPPRVTPGLLSSSTTTSSNVVDNNPVTEKPSLVKLVSGKGPELMEMGSISKSLDILTQQERFRHHVGTGVGVAAGAGLGLTQSTVNSMDVGDTDMGRTVLNIAVNRKEKEVTSKNQNQVQLEPQTQSTPPDVMRVENVNEKAQLQLSTSPLHVSMSMNMNNNKNEPVLESESVESDREDVHSNSSNNSSPATVMAAPHVSGNVNISSPSSSHNPLSMDPLPLRLMALSLPPSSSTSNLILATTSGSGGHLVGSGKPEDHSSGGGGIPGEDSGIDSMDALSEKSPNQGESPARKNENDHQFCDNSSTSHQPPHQQHAPLHHPTQHQHQPQPQDTLQHTHPQKNSSLSDPQSGSMSDVGSQLHHPPESLSATISSRSEPSSGDNSNINIVQSKSASTLTDVETVTQCEPTIPPSPPYHPPCSADKLKNVITDASDNILPSEDTPTLPVAEEALATSRTVLEAELDVPVAVAVETENNQLERSRGTEKVMEKEKENESSPVRNQVPLSLPSTSAATDLVASVSIASSSSSNSMTTATSSSTTPSLTSALTSQLSFPSAQQPHLHLLLPPSPQPEEAESDMDIDTNASNAPTETSSPIITPVITTSTEQEEGNSASDTHRTDFDTFTHVNNVVNIKNIVNCDNNMENILSELDNDRKDNDQTDAVSDTLTQLQPEVQLPQSPAPVIVPCSPTPGPSVINGNLTLIARNPSDKICDDFERTQRMELSLSSSTSAVESSSSSDLPLQPVNLIQIQSASPVVTSPESTSVITEPEGSIGEIKTEPVLAPAEDLLSSSSNRVESTILELDGDVEMTDVEVDSVCPTTDMGTAGDSAALNTSLPPSISIGPDLTKVDEVQEIQDQDSAGNLDEKTSSNLSKLLTRDDRIENVQLQSQAQAQIQVHPSGTNNSTSVNLGELAVLPSETEGEQIVELVKDSVADISKSNKSANVVLDNDEDSVNVPVKDSAISTTSFLSEKAIAVASVSEASVSEQTSPLSSSSSSYSKVVSISMGMEVDTCEQLQSESDPDHSNNVPTLGSSPQPQLSESLLPLACSASEQTSTPVETSPPMSLSMGQVSVPVEDVVDIIASAPIIKGIAELESSSKTVTSTSAFSVAVDGNSSENRSSVHQEKLTIINKSDDEDQTVSVIEATPKSKTSAESNSESEPKSALTSKVSGNVDVDVRSSSSSSPSLILDDTERTSASEKLFESDVKVLSMEMEQKQSIPTTIDSFSNYADAPLSSITHVEELENSNSKVIVNVDQTQSEVVENSEISVQFSEHFSKEIVAGENMDTKDSLAVPVPVVPVSTVVPAPLGEVTNPPALSVPFTAVVTASPLSVTTVVPAIPETTVVPSSLILTTSVVSPPVKPVITELSDPIVPVTSEISIPCATAATSVTTVPLNLVTTTVTPISNQSVTVAASASIDVNIVTKQSLNSATSPTEVDPAQPKSGAALAPVSLEPVAVVAPVSPKPVTIVARTSFEPVTAVAPVSPQSVTTLTPVSIEPVTAVAPVSCEPLTAAASVPVQPVETIAPVVPEPRTAITPVLIEPVTTMAQVSLEPVETVAPIPISVKPVKTVEVASVSPQPMVTLAPVSIEPVTTSPVSVTNVPDPIVSNNKNKQITEDSRTTMVVEIQKLLTADSKAQTVEESSSSLGVLPSQSQVAVVIPLNVVKSNAPVEVFEEENLPNRKDNESLSLPATDSKLVDSASLARKHEKEHVSEPELPPTEKMTHVNVNHPSPVVAAVVKPIESATVSSVLEVQPTGQELTISAQNQIQNKELKMEPKLNPESVAKNIMDDASYVTASNGSMLGETKPVPVNQNRIPVEVKTKTVIVPTVVVSSKSENATTNTILVSAPVPAPPSSVSSSMSVTASVASGSVAGGIREKPLQQPSESVVKVPAANAAKPKEIEDVKLRIKVDASTSTRSTNKAASAIIYPSKTISSNVSSVPMKDGKDKEKSVEPVVNTPANQSQPNVVPVPNQPVLMSAGGIPPLAPVVTAAPSAAVSTTQSHQHQSQENLNSKIQEAKQQQTHHLLQPKMTLSPAPNLSQVPPRSSRKDNIQHPLPILIPAPNQIPRESHSFQSFNVQHGSKPQMPSIAPMHKMKISPESTEGIHNSQGKGSQTTTATACVSVVNATAHLTNATNLESVHPQPAAAASSNSGQSPLPPILIRPNFQQSFQQHITLDTQHKSVPIQSQNLQNRQSIEISLPSKMEVKPNVNINVTRGVVPNVIQLTKASAANLTNRLPLAVTASQCHPGTKTSPISVSLSPLTGSATLGNTSGTPTVFAIHPQYHHHPSSITVLPSGHKMVPIKLVTIPKQNQAQLPLQSMVGSNRSSPTILEAVNIVAATSRSGSPISGGNKSKNVVHGNPVQTSPLNLTSVTSGNLHLVPISVASATASGTSSPVKVLVSSPMKMQPNLLQSMMVQGQIMMANQNQNHPATIRVVRPITSQNLQPPKLEPMSKHREREDKSVKFEAYLPTLSSSVVPHLPETSLATVAAVLPDKNSIYEHVDGVEVLETEDANEDDLFPFEADIIHDEKDLADVLADEENVTVTENGIGLEELDDPYDISNCLSTSHKSNHETCGNKSPTDSSSADVDIDKGMDSPIPAMRASSPLYTYSNRSGRNSHSASESRSPSPPEPDVHGEDQEIIDCLSRSPSQPKLSPQNKPLLCLENDNDQDNDYGSPTKPELHPDHTYVGKGKRGENSSSTSSSASSSAPQLEQLSIEIPPVDLMAMSPAATEENRKSTRNTRSNTRLVSPDITAFRSDTPKPTKFTNKPDALILRNSPKPSPTGSIKTHSPGLANIQPSTSTRASPIPNQLSVNLSSGIHPITGRNSPSLLASSLAVSLSAGRGGSGGLAGTAFINKRKRQESDSSNASKDENSEENKIDIDLNSRPGKRRCSENAAELIKACIGVEDTPKRNSSLIKKMELQDTKAKDAASGKGKKPIMSVVVEENEDDLESVDLLNRGRGGGRSSRGSSEDRSSSRGSSVHRSTVTPKSSVKESDEHKDSKANSRVNNRAVGSKDMTTKSKVQGTGRDSPNPNANLSKKDDKAQSAVGRRSNRNAPTKEKSPLTPAKTRTNVRKEPLVTGGTEKATTPSTSPENGNPRRKTRSSVAVGMSDSSMPSFKRRRISKDAKS